MSKTFKKFIMFFMIFQTLFISTSLAENKPNIYMEDAIKYQNSDEVTVNIYVENMNSNIVTLGLDVEYDPQILEYVDTKNGKDLSSTLNIADNYPEEKRVALGAVSIGGFKKDGLYYSVIFKVKDTSNSEIPLKLSVRELTDKNGVDIEKTIKDGKIIISSETKEIEEKKTTKPGSVINSFTKTDVEEIENIENVLKQNGNLQVEVDDRLNYNTSNSEVVEVLEDGTIIPNKDGVTTVGVDLNGEKIGNLEIEVEDGKIKQISQKALKIQAQNNDSNNIKYVSFIIIGVFIIVIATLILKRKRRF